MLDEFWQYMTTSCSIDFPPECYTGEMFCECLDFKPILLMLGGSIIIASIVLGVRVLWLKVKNK